MKSIYIAPFIYYVFLKALRLRWDYEVYRLSVGTMLVWYYFQGSSHTSWCWRPLGTSTEVFQAWRCVSAMAQRSHVVSIYWMLGTGQRPGVQHRRPCTPAAGWLWSRGYIQLAVLSWWTHRGVCRLSYITVFYAVIWAIHCVPDSHWLISMIDSSFPYCDLTFTMNCCHLWPWWLAWT